MAKVLLYDLEVSPTLGWSYGLWDTNILHVERHQHLMCFGYKWLDEDETSVIALPDFPRYKRDKFDDSLLVHALWDLFDEADIIIAHNGNKFDYKMVMERFVIHGLPAPSPVRMIDTYAVAKKLFYTKANSLDKLCRRLGIGGKTENTHASLWHACLDGDLEAWDMMADYCANDITMLEQVYLKLLPYIPNHTPVSHGFTCPSCGSDHVQSRGYHTSAAGIRYRKYQCQSCLSWSRDRLQDKQAEKPKLASI